MISQFSGVGPVGRIVANNVRQLREARGMTKQALAAAALERGRNIPSLAISRTEEGTRRVDADDLAVLADVFGVTVQRLLEAEACPQCHGAPPAGFTCNACTPPVQPRAEQRHHRITPELLDQVAEVYRTACFAGEAPTLAVASHYSIPHSTAAKWVAKARKQFMLGETTPGQSGEQS